MPFETEENVIIYSSTTPLIQGETTFAEELYTSKNIETSDSLEENLHKYRARDDRFVIVPSENKYYDLKTESTEVIEDEMVIGPYKDAIEIIQKLAYCPFLLVDLESNSEFKIYDKDTAKDSKEIFLEEPDSVIDYNELSTKYPDIFEEYNSNLGRSRYGIITASEINKRHIKEVLYPIIAEFEKEIAQIIKNEYPKSDELTDVVGNAAERVWEQNKNNSIEVHISEFLNLSDMQKLVEDSDSLAKKCGFKTSEPSPDEPITDLSEMRKYDVDFVFEEIRTLRNKVMHANRALVKNKSEIKELDFRLQLLFTFIDLISDEFEVS